MLEIIAYCYGLARDGIAESNVKNPGYGANR
jgi:hypothetical protein